MREIKFRVWHRANKKMYSIWRIDFDDFGKPNRVYWDMQQGKFEVGHEISRVLELMQYTGLKDKNGKREIFEGDIVRMPLMAGSKDTFVGEVVIADGGNQGVYDMRVWVKLPNNSELQFFHKDPKVIGNIYENPELLK